MDFRVLSTGRRGGAQVGGVHRWEGCTGGRGAQVGGAHR